MTARQPADDAEEGLSFVMAIAQLRSVPLSVAINSIAKPGFRSIEVGVLKTEALQGHIDDVA
ncbi:MAG: hypothetical protein NW216_14490 [Hyphomicrobium sp.]|nr:hypothetical protein [Hyphomicrobium sp.]